MGKKKLLENAEFDGWELLDSEIMWASEEWCAEKLNMSVDTLVRRIKEKHGLNFAEYKAKRSEKLDINVRMKQYEACMKLQPTMLIWWGKNRLGQTDKNENTNLNANIEIVYEKDDGE